jgi:V8-like Glu-specific endopeptidase
MAGSLGCNAHAFTEKDKNALHRRNEMPLTSAETLMHTTVRLECTLNNGRMSTGTGFFFSFKVDDTTHVPVIITNKHVINNSKVGAFVLTKSNEQGEPNRGSTERVILDNFENLWVKHPEKNVDLAAFPIAPLYHQAEAKGIKFFAPPIGEDLLPSDAKLADLSGLENITMIGYPNGIWDEKNNLPIVRRGITATNPKYDYNGLPIFVIDCACFPGSSGSPVLIFDQGGYLDAKGNLNLGSGRLMLLGVLFAGPQHVAEGEIQTIEVPLAQVPISLSKIPNNLGFVIKARKIADFRKMLIPNG